MSILGNAARPKLSTPPVRLWIYGAPNSGKTHFAKQFPNPLLLSTDGNYVYETIPANSLNAWEVGPLAKDEQKEQAYMNILQVLKTSNPFDTIILDLVDGAFRLARNHYINLLKIQHESDLSYGKAYKIINENFISAIEQLFKLPVNIIIISHEDKDRIEPKNAAPYTVFKPMLDDKYHEVFEGYCNLVARVYVDIDNEGNRVRKLSLSPKEHEYGINRLGDTEDLILAHNGDNYGDFLAIWQELFENRGLNHPVRVKNATREIAKKDKAEAEKAELLAQAKRAEEKAAAEKVIVKEETQSVEPEKVEEKEAADKVAEKLAKIQKAKNEFKKESTPKPESKEEDEIGDGEPTIVKTDAIAEKMARIKALKEKHAASTDNK